MNNIKEYILKRLLGAFEIAILMPTGLKRFDGTARETLLSFSILLIVTPFSYFIVDVHKPLGAEDFSASHIFIVNIGVFIISFIINFLLIYGFVKYVTKNSQHLWLFYTIGNWVAAVFIPISVLFYYLELNDIMAYKTIEDINILLILYKYYITGFIVFHIFRPPWELAAAFTCGILVMGQVVHDMIYKLSDLPVVDYMEVFG